MTEEIIKCIECKQEKPRSEFRNVKRPEMCKVCIISRKSQRKIAPIYKKRTEEPSERNTIYLSARQQAILNVLSLGKSRSQVVQEALEIYFEKQPKHVKEFLGYHEKEVVAKLIGKKDGATDLEDDLH